MEDTEEDKKITETIQLLTSLMEVKSSVKNNVTEDYTLAYFGKDEKEYISENYQNAEFAKELVNRFGEKGYYYQFDEKKGDWIKNEDGSVKKIPLEPKVKNKIESMSKRIFTFFMVHPHMLAILNRNKTDNFLVKLLGKDNEEEKPSVFNADERSIFQKIKDKLSGNEKETFEED